MAPRLTFLAATSILLATIGCDKPYTPPPSTRTAAPEVGTAIVTPGAGGERISLVAIPFTVQAPDGWLVQPGVISNQIVLHGRTSSGEFDVLMGQAPSITPAALPLLLKESAQPTTRPHFKREVTQHDGITYIKRVAPQLDPKAPAPTDPALVPMEWSIQCIVNADTKADYMVYDLTFNGLSQAMFDSDESKLQAVIDTLRYEPAATKPAMPVIAEKVVMPAKSVTRLAPSPTGALHLGNARTFLVNWLLARSRGWRVVLRIEDLDGPRIKAGADRQALEDLCWLGLDWDEGPVYQSAGRDSYASVVTKLLADGRAYPCTCTRREIEQAASAPHAEDGASVYPGTCRDRYASVDAARRAVGREPAIRFRVDEHRVIRWHDAFAGDCVIRLGTLGDFVIAKADGTPAYQLAVVVDDAGMNVTHIVRGDDLLDSTPRQIALYEALNLGPRPTYYHLPLIVGTDGRRLAKRHGDTRLSSYRRDDASPQRVLSLLARWCGIMIHQPPDSVREWVERFDVRALPVAPIVLTAEDSHVLRS